jgi:hypothetical protein
MLAVQSSPVSGFVFVVAVLAESREEDGNGELAELLPVIRRGPKVAPTVSLVLRVLFTIFRNR